MSDPLYEALKMCLLTDEELGYVSGGTDGTETIDERRGSHSTEERMSYCRDCGIYRMSSTCYYNCEVWNDESW